MLQGRLRTKIPTERRKYDDNRNQQTSESAGQFPEQSTQRKKTIVVYLLNGFQVRGRVWGFDNFTVIMECEGKQQLIYKHAISTIAPLENEAILVLKKGNDQGVTAK